MALGPVDLERAAFFLDFDGTLVAIAERPDCVRLEARTAGLLKDLFRRTEGAVAIITGRPIAAMETFDLPAGMPVAGSHGLELRAYDGAIQRRDVDEEALAAAVESLTRFAEADERLIVERKPASVTLHFRQAPEHRSASEELARDLVVRYPTLSLLEGKMVVELKAGKADKAEAVTALMELAPFAARRPVAAGDDVTDEAAFAAVRRLGGVAIKVGPGPTAADYRAPTIREFHLWLASLIERGSVTQAKGRET